MTETITLNIDYLLDWIIICEVLEHTEQPYESKAFFNSKGRLVLVIAKKYETN